MNLIIKSGITITIFCFLFSCGTTPNGKTSESEGSPIDSLVIAQNSKDTIILEKDTTENQFQLFKELIDAIALSNMEVYNTKIMLYTDVNALFPLQFSGEEEEGNYSLLGYAARLGTFDIVKDLVEKRKADIDIATEDEIFAQDALYAAIAGQNIEIVRYLLDKGSDINAIYSESGSTPLDLAVITQDTEVVELLLSRGAKVDGAGDLGFDYITYPLHTAISVGNVEIVRILLQYGANPLLKTKDGEDAMALALRLDSDIDLIEELGRKEND